LHFLDYYYKIIASIQIKEMIMSRRIVRLVVTLLLVNLFMLTGIAQEKVYKYVGVKNCKMCHSSKKSGEAYKIWAASSHAKAYATLASAESKKIAEEKGIKDPQKAAECLSCHVTAYGVEQSLLEKGYVMEDGVTCEACHGPGSEYNPMKIMKQISAGEVKGADYGLKDPDKKNCVSCHNEKSPTFKGFDFEKYVAQIAHPTPK
jgi:hypothetical protein